MWKHWAWDAVAAVTGVLLGGILGGALGSLLARGSSNPWADLIGAVVGMLIGAAVVPPLTLWLGGRFQQRPGHPWLALLGSSVGLGIVMGLRILEWVPLAVVLVAAGALLGFRRLGR